MRRAQPARPTPFCRHLTALVLPLAVLLLAGARAAAFDLDDVTAQAAALARQPYDDAHARVPEWLLKINYDQWRDIRFRPPRALWRDAQLPFQVQFFHPGLYYDRTVAINVVDAQAEVPHLATGTSRSARTAVPRLAGTIEARAQAGDRRAGELMRVRQRVRGFQRGRG